MQKNHTHYTPEHLKKLKEIYASGLLRTKFGDREIIYKSEDELKKAIAQIERELGKQHSYTFTPIFSKGL